MEAIGDWYMNFDDVPSRQNHLSFYSLGY